MRTECHVGDQRRDEEQGTEAEAADATIDRLEVPWGEHRESN